MDRLCYEIQIQSFSLLLASSIRTQAETIQQIAVIFGYTPFLLFRLSSYLLSFAFCLLSPFSSSSSSFSFPFYFVFSSTFTCFYTSVLFSSITSFFLLHFHHHHHHHHHHHLLLLLLLHSLLLFLLLRIHFIIFLHAPSPYQLPMFGRKQENKLTKPLNSEQINATFRGCNLMVLVLQIKLCKENNVFTQKTSSTFHS